MRARCRRLRGGQIRDTHLPPYCELFSDARRGVRTRSRRQRRQSRARHGGRHHESPPTRPRSSTSLRHARRVREVPRSSMGLGDDRAITRPRGCGRLLPTATRESWNSNKCNDEPMPARRCCAARANLLSSERFRRPGQGGGEGAVNSTPARQACRQVRIRDEARGLVARHVRGKLGGASGSFVSATDSCGRTTTSCCPAGRHLE